MYEIIYEVPKVLRGLLLCKMYKFYLMNLNYRIGTGKISRSPKTNRRRTPVKKSQKAPLWAWVVIGFLAAALLALLIFLVNRSDSPLAAKAPDKAVSQSPEENPSSPRFDFYEILKEREVTVPDRSGEVEAAVKTDVELFLQVASFRNASDADELRANLLLQNLDAFVERVERNGNQWHRVVVGPFASRSRMARARSDLASQEFNTLLIRRKSE